MKYLILISLLFISLSLSACQKPIIPPPDIERFPSLSPLPSPPNQEACTRAGCSSQLCVDIDQANQVYSDCSFKPEYRCYQAAACEHQANGQCGFTQTPELQACLKTAQSTPN